MDLLEYMRSQNNMTQAEWERTFEEEVREILVLLAGSSCAASRWTQTLLFPPTSMTMICFSATASWCAEP